MEAAFGVHIGNTSACLAVQRDGRCDVVANDAGDRVTPAVVGWSGDEILVGLAAKQLSARFPKSVISGCKSFVGCHSEIGDVNTSTAKPILNESRQVEFEVERENGKSIKIGAFKALTEIFKYMHEIALSHASADVDKHSTVLTVPIEFDQEQRQAVTDAAEKVGFRIVQVINEPTAACLAYNLGQLDPLENFKCLVYRCGGKSISVSVVQIQSGMVQIVKSITRRGIGGDRLTELLSGFLAEEFLRKFRADPRESKRSRQKLTTNAENVKHILSTLETANCYIESLYEGIDFNCNVARARFDNELSKVLPELMSPIHEVLESAQLQASDIEKVILCGGSSKIPKLQKSIAALFPKSELLSNLNPDELIAMGAADQASLIEDKLTLAGDQNPNSGSVRIPALSQSVVFEIEPETTNDSSDSETRTVLIPAGCPVPVRRSNHLNLQHGTQTCTAKVFLQSFQESLKLAELTLQSLKDDSKVSLSAHIHRDASLHLALTDKISGQADQITLNVSA